MDDLDFSHLAPQPATPPAAAVSAAATPPAAVTATQIPNKALPVDPHLAARFFSIAGEEETVEPGAVIFAEGDRPGAGLFARKARMYFLLEGQVALTLRGKPLHLVLPGEHFGELAIISDAPRSATATALRKSRLAAMDEKRVLQALPQVPEFALQLVSNLTGQMRRSVERLLAARRPVAPRTGGSRLGATEIAALRRALGDPVPTPMKQGETVVNQGATGIYMFVLLEGFAAISVDGAAVEQVGPGETFGEVALLGATARAATAVAASDGAWLPVNRDGFLRIVRAQPAIGLALLRSMGERVRHLNAQLG
ncbi:MAG: cyclic nucleotide-binding domain-containing protein [Burkholderiales bacterium]|nr:cyclic nucleotide-binding domain-containing protein [Burkholderiales bacterium]